MIFKSCKNSAVVLCHPCKQVCCVAFLRILINKTLTGQPVAPSMANVFPKPAFIMAGDNDAQVLQGKNHSVSCLAWVLTGMATEGILTMYFEEVLILWRGQKKIIPDIRVSKAICKT